jgi:3-deoxy-D-manno-octulosonic-acid transferase
VLLDVFYLLAAILLLPWFAYRRFIKRKQSAPLREKLGHIADRAPGKKRIWIHAVSVGEAAAVEVLLKALREKMPDAEVVISTTTVTGQSVAAKRYGADNVFYYPLDLSGAVKRALDRVKPAVLVLMELEVWPNMTAECQRRGIPVIVVNGRITERAAGRYGRFWFLVGPSFHRVKRWLVQTEEYAARLKSLGVKDDVIEIAGNIKYDAIDTTLADEKSKIRKSLGIAVDAPVLLGGSTHPSEEATLLAAHKALSQKIPALRLILVPRHPERTAEVEGEIKAAGLAPLRLTTLREKTQHSGLSTQDFVLLVDTVGVLKDMYKAADVAFVGGSLIPHGGQNVMEPCGLGVAVVHGPHMHNFNDAMEILNACKGSVEVSRESLAAEIEKLLRDPAAAKAMATRAREGFIAKQGATKRAVEYIASVIQCYWRTI